MNIHKLETEVLKVVIEMKPMDLKLIWNLPINIGRNLKQRLKIGKTIGSSFW